MKAKLKLLMIGVSSILTLVIILNAYLINSDKNVSEYKAKSAISTANYLNIEEQKGQQDIQKESEKEESEDKTEEPKEEVVPAIVYDGLTLEQLSNKLNKILSSSVSGKGNLIASYSLEKGVDPYLATAIMMHETGCRRGCSRLVTECNNVGGQKGSGCGSYKAYNSLDEGIKGFIDNIYKNYVSYGLTTPETMNSKYAEDRNWSVNVNKYIEIIKAQ